MKRFLNILIIIGALSFAGILFAEEQQATTPAPAVAVSSEAPKIDTGDTAWMIVATAFFMLMTLPGLALFYGGLAKRKDSLNTMAMSFVTYCIVSFLWVLYGFSFTFGTDIGGIIGSAEKLLLSGVGINSINDLAKTIPEYVYVVYQMTFAAITVALASGAYIERMKFSAWVLFSILWMTLVVTGAGLLWFGWFGFNAGSALAANGLAGAAFINTNTAAALAAISWMFTEWVHTKKPTVLGLASGAVAGLVAITPAAGFVNIKGAMIIGMLAGIVPYFAVAMIKPKLGYDDSLDAFGIHGVGGILGAILTGIFADPAINEAGKGLLYGNPGQLVMQLIAVVVTMLYSGDMTLIIFMLVKAVVGIRVDAEHEIAGLDESQHGEKA